MKGIMIHLFSIFSFPNFCLYQAWVVDAVTERLTSTLIKAKLKVQFTSDPFGAVKTARLK